MRSLFVSALVVASLAVGGCGLRPLYANGSKGAVAQGLGGWFDGAALRVDLDKVPALAEDRMALWREVSAADWLSADEKKALLGLG